MKTLFSVKDSKTGEIKFVAADSVADLETLGFEFDEIEEYADLTFLDSTKKVEAQGGMKFDNNKPRISLIPREALEGMAKALTFGSVKYSAHNFKNGLLYSRLADATLRHILAWVDNETNDPESGLSHLDHALASLSMLKYMEVNKPEMDDRYVKKT